MKDLNTPKDLMDIFPLTIEITQKHLDNGDIDSPFADPLTLAVIDKLKTLVTPKSFKDLLILSGVHFMSIKLNKNFNLSLRITKDDKTISVSHIISPMAITLIHTKHES